MGDKYGDPGNCTVYYECSSATNVLDLHHCDAGSKYDYKKKKCRVERPNLRRAIRCTPPCDEQSKDNKRNKEKEEEVEIVPEVETARPVSERSQNATSEASQSITEANAALTTEDEEKVEAAGSFVKDNDTVVPAMVDPNQGVPSAAAANTTAGYTAEETEAQTEKDDVITTPSSSSTSPSTPSSTPSPIPSPTSQSTKSTTKSTTTTRAGVVIVETDGDPGYDVVTSPPSNSSGSAG